MIRFLLGFSFLLLLISCDKVCKVMPLFCKQEAIVKDTIDFTKVDQFPVFDNCDALLDFTTIKDCFEITLYDKITEKISELNLKTEHHIEETIEIKFSVLNNGSFQCKKIICSDSLHRSLPELPDDIQEIIHDLKPINPALKRGIPVETNYTIPVEIYVE